MREHVGMSDAESSHHAAAGRSWAIQDGFDVEGFLARPLVARVAASGPNGPTVRPVWYLWEGGYFWWLTGGCSKLGQLLDVDPRVALVVDTSALERGEVLQVTAQGTAQLRPFDVDRARRWGRRYLGPDERHWRRFQGGVFEIPPRVSSSWIRQRFGRATFPTDPIRIEDRPSGHPVTGMKSMSGNLLDVAARMAA